MLLENEIADTLVVFKKDPCEKGKFSDEPEVFLWLTGQKIDPNKNVVYILRDVIGYEWEVPCGEIGNDKEYDWLKKCYPRVLSYIATKG